MSASATDQVFLLWVIGGGSRKGDNRVFGVYATREAALHAAKTYETAKSADDHFKIDCMDVEG